MNEPKNQKRPTMLVICEDKEQKTRLVKKAQARGMRLSDYLLKLIKIGESEDGKE